MNGSKQFASLAYTLLIVVAAWIVGCTFESARHNRACENFSDYMQTAHAYLSMYGIDEVPGQPLTELTNHYAGSVGWIELRLLFPKGMDPVLNTDEAAGWPEWLHITPLLADSIGPGGGALNEASDSLPMRWVGASKCYTTMPPQGFEGEDYRFTFAYSCPASYAGRCIILTADLNLKRPEKMRVGAYSKPVHVFQAATAQASSEIWGSRVFMESRYGNLERTMELVDSMMAAGYGNLRGLYAAYERFDYEHPLGKLKLLDLLWQQAELETDTAFWNAPCCPSYSRGQLRDLLADYPQCREPFLSKMVLKGEPIDPKDAIPALEERLKFVDQIEQGYTERVTFTYSNMAQCVQKCSTLRAAMATITDMQDLRYLLERHHVQSLDLDIFNRPVNRYGQRPGVAAGLRWERAQGYGYVDVIGDVPEDSLIRSFDEALSHLRAEPGLLIETRSWSGSTPSAICAVLSRLRNTPSDTLWLRKRVRATQDSVDFPFVVPAGQNPYTGPVVFIVGERWPGSGVQYFMKDRAHTDFETHADGVTFGVWYEPVAKLRDIEASVATAVPLKADKSYLQPPAKMIMTATDCFGDVHRHAVERLKKLMAGQ